MSGTQKVIADLLGTDFRPGQYNTIGSPQFRNLTVSARNVVPVLVSAAGTTQGAATLITNHTNIITICAANAGVRIGTDVFAELINAAANPCRIYPPSGAQFWTPQTQAFMTINAWINLGIGEAIKIYMISATQGYAV